MCTFEKNKNEDINIVKTYIEIYLNKYGNNFLADCHAIYEKKLENIENLISKISASDLLNDEKNNLLEKKTINNSNKITPIINILSNKVDKIEILLNKISKSDVSNKVNKLELLVSEIFASDLLNDEKIKLMETKLIKKEKNNLIDNNEKILSTINNLSKKVDEIEKSNLLKDKKIKLLEEKLINQENNIINNKYDDIKILINENKKNIEILESKYNNLIKDRDEEIFKRLDILYNYNKNITIKLNNIDIIINNKTNIIDKFNNRLNSGEEIIKKILFKFPL